MEVGVGAVDLQRLVPHHRLQSLDRLPVELHVGRASVGVDHPERVDTEALHESEGSGNGPVGHGPQQHVGRLRHQRGEVPEVVVCRLGLGEPTVGLLLGRVDQVGELHRVLDEEHRDVVADEVPVALPRVELRREATDIAGEVGGPLAARHRREPDEDRRALARPLEQVGPGQLAQRLVVLEEAMCPEAAGVHHTLRDALVVEVEDLLAEVEVLEQRRTPPAGRERVLIIRHRHTLPRRECGSPVMGRLVGLAAVPPGRLYVTEVDGLCLITHQVGPPRRRVPRAIPRHGAAKRRRPGAPGHGVGRRASGVGRRGGLPAEGPGHQTGDAPIRIVEARSQPMTVEEESADLQGRAAPRPGMRRSRRNMPPPTR